MTSLWQDLRFGVRSMYKHLGFTALAVFGLALGIGASTTMFTVVDAFILRPLPFQAPDELVRISETAPGGNRFTVSPAIYLEWKKQNQVFSDLSSTRFLSFNVAGRDHPEAVYGALVSPNFFSLLGVKPVRGRLFTPEEERPEAENVAILSHSLWQRRFGGDPQVLRQTVTVDGRVHTVIGILPPEFWFFSGTPDLWMPLRWEPGEISDPGRRSLNLVLGRLQKGVTIEQTQAAVSTIAGRFQNDFPKTNTGWLASVLPLQQWHTEDVRPTFMLLLGAVGFVLMITCSNTANLLLARSAFRQTEMAVRSALGAGGWRLARQTLTESVLLAGAGGTLGLLLSFWGAQLVAAILPTDIRSRIPEGAIQIDNRVLAFTLAISVLTGLAFGLVPALRGRRANVNRILQKSGRSAGAGLGGATTKLLVVLEIALSMSLVVGAGLMIQSLAVLRNLDPGFNPRNVLMAGFAPLPHKYRDERQKAAVYARVLERVQALPGVESAGLEFPVLRDDPRRGFVIEGQSPKDPADTPFAQLRTVDTNYFHTMGIALVKGRFFNSFDNESAPAVAIITSTMARRFWPNEDPIGKRIRRRDRQVSSWISIVGVVGDVRFFGREFEPQAIIYQPYPQNPPVWMSLVVRTAADPTGLFNAVRKEIWTVDREQIISRPHTIEEFVSQSVSQPRFVMRLLGILAGLALALAALGIYGVTAYSVSQRTQEIGVRMALGAAPVDVFRLVVGQVFQLALGGVVAGLALSFAFQRVIAHHLYGVSVTDPVTLGGLAMLLIAIALLAAYLPARKAAKVYPSIALRYD